MPKETSTTDRKPTDEENASDDLLADLAEIDAGPRHGHPIACPGPHDHLLDEDTMRTTCGDCGRPAFYCYTTDRYHHGVNPSTGCFLIPAESTV